VPFNSVRYFAFLGLVLAIYNLVPARGRAAVLLLASYVFYANTYPFHLAFLLLVTVVAYVGGRVVSVAERRQLLPVFIAISILPLVFFKLVTFMGSPNGPVDQVEHRELIDLLLPLGLSFYTLQAIAYLVDVKRGVAPAETNPISVGLFIAFFPQILAGPIARAGRLLPQLTSLPGSSPKNAYAGLKCLLWGFFCKLVVADNTAAIVDSVLGEPRLESGGSLAIAFGMYSWQLYFDFFGYSSIAMGTALLFGVRLDRNFNTPYRAASLKEFWRRWHISLSSWFRDYIYMPLGGRFTNGVRRIGQVMTVFVVSGLWHGAALNFLAWGGAHGVAYLGEEWVTRRLNWPEGRTHTAFAWARQGTRVATTFALVSLGWVFFRLSDFSDIGLVFARVLLIDSAVPYGGMNPVITDLRSMLTIGLLVTAVALDSWRRLPLVLVDAPKTPRELAAELAVVNVIGIALLLFGNKGAADFVYFRF